MEMRSWRSKESRKDRQLDPARKQNEKLRLDGLHLILSGYWNSALLSRLTKSLLKSH
jgi:hypothetical protein